MKSKLATALAGSIYTGGSFEKHLKYTLQKS